MSEPRPVLTDGGQSTEGIVIEELTRVVEPVGSAAVLGPERIVALLDEMGIGEALLDEELEKVVSVAENSIIDPVTTLVGIVEEGDFGGGDIKDAVVAVKSIIDGIKELSELEFQSPPPRELGELVLDYLLVTYLESYHEPVYNVLSMIDVVKNPPSEPPEVDFSRIGDAVSDPKGILLDSLDWGTEEFEPAVIVYYLKAVCWRAGLTAQLETPGQSVIEELYNDGSIPDDGPDKSTLDGELRLPVLQLDGVSTGVRVVPLPGREDALPGLAVVPYGKLEASGEWDISDHWTFNLEVSGSVSQHGFGARPTKDGGIEGKHVSLDGSTTPGKAHGEAGAQYSPSGEEEETVIVGSSEGSRLALKHMAARVSLDYADGSVSVAVEVPAKGTVGVHPNDFDGFLTKVLPGDGIFYDFDMTVGWSSKTGVYFERGGTLEVSLPQNASIGPATLQEIFLGLGAGGDDSGGSAGSDLGLTAAASTSVELGPLTASIQRMGVSADIAFPNDASGNLGPMDLGVGFDPPDGIGLSVDAGVVTGGGYLEFDHENERYAGVLQLHAGTITINAVGLLTTRLPGGRDGFSLLILISGEFTPIQLGFGFTLNGVGGLLGINRSVRAKPLGKAVRAGTLDSILFPENPVANAQRIISDLRAVFPPTAGQHVFGPMAKLGWGSPTLIVADLGIVVQLPRPKFVLLGSLSAVLPDDIAPLIELNLDVAGVFDPPGQRASIDASLYDSRVVAWSLSGDAAMRSRWGDDPRFVLSVGGFHPRFDPPGEFPELRRVTAALGPPGGNPKLEYSGYFAVTSNTVQGGADAHLLAKAGPLKIEGKIGLDALFQFDPFKFVVDFMASISVTFKGHGLTISLDGTISGPGPFRVRGKIHIEILFFSVTASADVKIGHSNDREQLPPAKILPKLAAAVGDADNWAANNPDHSAVVSLREVEKPDGTVLVHPLATIGVRQTVVPLSTPIERFGNHEPASHTTFAITAAGIEGQNGLSLGADTTERFAPAQYQNLSDGEKMDSPAFESYPAGKEMADDGLYAGFADGSRSTNVRVASTGYETTVIDRRKNDEAVDLGELGQFGTVGKPAVLGLPDSMVEAAQHVGRVARGELHTSGVAGFRLRENVREKMHRATAEAGTREAIDDTDGRGPDERVTDGTDGAASGNDDGLLDVEGQTTDPKRAANPDAGGLATTLSLDEERYVVADQVEGRTVELSETTTDMTETSARRALARHVEREPGNAGRYQVLPARKAKARSVDDGSVGGTAGGDDGNFSIAPMGGHR